MDATAAAYVGALAVHLWGWVEIGKEVVALVEDASSNCGLVTQAKSI